MTLRSRNGSSPNKAAQEQHTSFLHNTTRRRKPSEQIRGFFCVVVGALKVPFLQDFYICYDAVIARLTACNRWNSNTLTARADKRMQGHARE